MAPSSSLPYSGDPGTTLARACLNASDFTTVERSGTARSRLFPRSDPLRLIQIERLGPQVPLRARLFPRSDFPPSDLDHTARTPSNPSLRPILIERPRPQDIASHPHALTPWPACQCPCPLALGPLGQCALPLCR
jgi:hypothetical protein